MSEIHDFEPKAQSNDTCAVCGQPRAAHAVPDAVLEIEAFGVRFSYRWDIKRRASGDTEYRLMCPLFPGEKRPAVLATRPGEAADGALRWGRFFASHISGYTRQFHILGEALADAADIPMRVFSPRLRGWFYRGEYERDSAPVAYAREVRRLKLGDLPPTERERELEKEARDELSRLASLRNQSPSKE